MQVNKNSKQTDKTGRRLNVNIIGEIRPLLFPSFNPDGVDDVVPLVRNRIVLNVFPCLSCPVRVKEKEPPNRLF
jgi:hypothetical protein